MEDQAEPPASTFPPSASSLQTSITAQNSAENIVPQVIGCQIGGSLNITVGTSTPANAQHQQASARGSNTESRISERVTERLKCRLKRKFDMIFEGLAKRGKPALLRDIYTELYITEGESGGLNKEHEVWQIDTAFKTPSEQDIPISCNDMFRPLNIQKSEGKNREDENNVQRDDAQKRPPRTVLTKGIAGIGKTVSVQKFILDWAEGKANQDIDLLLVLPFRELNSIKDEELSLHELLLNFHCELREFENPKYYDDSKILFIFDGLDESKLLFDFEQGPISDVSKPASLDELMTNLITGNLLPSALIWITSRPAAIEEIPPHLVHRMTEVRGFTDSQKEEYFRKKISNQSLASRIISHVKGSRTLEIMCHIPVFCWITAMVLEQMLKGSDEKIPSSLTELYTRFLLIQTSEKKKKYHGTKETDPRNLSEEDVQLILKLGKLAFDNLQKRNIVFSEDDLQKYGIDITEASLRSGMFTEILKQEDPMFSEKMYSFVHLSFQEYLAALYVLHTFAHKRENVMQATKKQHLALHGYGYFGCDIDDYDDDDYDDDDDADDDKEDDGDEVNLAVMVPQQKLSLYDLQKCAINKALESTDGHLDLFLRFLLGLSLKSNQTLLRSFLINVDSWQRSILQTLQYLKSKLREDVSEAPSAEQCVNLFNCLLELNDHSVGEEIQKFLSSDRQAEQNLTAAQCSTLAYIILVSGELLEELDPKKYNTSEEGRRRLIPAIRNCRKAVLSDCNLTKKCFETVISVLQNPMACLRELDISNQFLAEALTSLHAGLNSPNCRLETLNLSQINLEKTGADVLTAILMGPHIQPYTLRLFGCSLTDDCADVLVKAFWSSQCQLRVLDLSYNNFSPKAMKHILQGLLSPYCDLQVLRLSGNSIGADLCIPLASVLRHSFLTELILDSSEIGNIGVKALCGGLVSPHCQLQRLGMKDCKLSKKACFYLTVVLSTYSVLRELNLGDNDLQDSGANLLSTMLKNPNCILQNLGLSGCMVTEEGCSSLASALNSNPFHLKELDLSYNHPGQSGEKMLCTRLNDPRCKLETLKLIHGGKSRITAGLWKYYHELNLSYLTGGIYCSSDKKVVIRPHSPEPLFYDSNMMKGKPDSWATVHSVEELTGARFYWELEWTGFVTVGISDKKLYLGKILELFFPHQYPCYAMHNDQGRTKSLASVSKNLQISKRIGVFLDWTAGTLSFYSISGQQASHLYTFHTTFTKPMFATFKLNLPNVMNGLPSIALATRSPDSIQRSKTQLFEHLMSSGILATTQWPQL